VRGYVATALLQGKKKDLPLYSSSNGGLLVNAAGGESSPAHADFEPDVSDEYAEVSVGDKLYLLFMGESRTSEEGMRELPNRRIEGISRIASGHGLVLRITAGGEDNYSRVGTFCYQGAAKWEAWKAIRTKRTICLV